MPALSDTRLRSELLAALPGARVIGDPGHTKPIVLDVPTFGRVRVYLWTTTPDASKEGRPEGENKAQIILPGTLRGSRQHLVLGDMPTALLGYSPMYGVFTARQASLHSDSGYSANLQFPAELMEDSRAFGWAVAEPRRTNQGPEVRVVVHRLHLAAYLRAMREADEEGLSGEKRRDFLLRLAPPLIETEVETPSPDGSATERTRVLTRRLRRNSLFGRMVRRDYGDSCAVCALRLPILEGAHIIPVHDPRSLDERWNGVCLCPNHHALFDSRILRIDRVEHAAIIRVEQEDVAVLTKMDQLRGYEEALAPFLGRQIHLPDFCRTDPGRRARLLDAFGTS